MKRFYSCQFHCFYRAFLRRDLRLVLRDLRFLVALRFFRLEDLLRDLDFLYTPAGFGYISLYARFQ